MIFYLAYWSLHWFLRGISLHLRAGYVDRGANMAYTGTSRKEQGGFSLIELLAAMVILCIGLLALFSCFGTTIISNAYAAERADAVRVAQAEMEAVKGLSFDDVSSKNKQIDRNGIIYACQIMASARQDNPYLKDVAVTVSWISHRSSDGVEEQVQLATAVLHR